MAVVLPMLLAVMFGFLAASQLIYFRKSLVTAASEGVRFASQRAVTSAEVEARVTAVLASRRIEGASIVLTPENLEQMVPGELVELQIRADFLGIGFGILGEGVTVPVTVNAAILRE